MNKWISYLLASLMLVMSVGASAELDNMGTEFIFAFQNNYGDAAQLKLFITAEQDTQGLVEIPGLNFSETFAVQANQVTSLLIPSRAQSLLANGSKRLGIHLTAENEVSVYGLSQQQYTTDAFLALPVDVLSTEYLAASYDGLVLFPGLPSQIAVVAVEDNTVIEITPKADVSGGVAGEPFTVALNRLDVYQFSHNTEDLSGSIIKSSAPVAVMGGHKCADVPTATPRVGWCDHLIEMMPPLNSWGQSFATVPLASRLKGDIVRILASRDDTEILINNVPIISLNRGELHERVLTAHSHIQASAPVMVIQYSPGQGFDGVATDPFMMLIPPSEQFLQQYTFATPETGFTKNFINVVVPTTAISSVALDGVAINPVLFTVVGSSGLSGAQVPILSGAHTITAAERFGLYVYGYSSYESYGYPGGLALSKINPIVDLYPPNISDFKHIGHTFLGAVTDSEDLNANGILDAGEDINANGSLNRRTEDVNGNGVLDAGEDDNANGYIDSDRGVLRVELVPGANNLILKVLEYGVGQSPRINFRLDLIDRTMPGTGTLRVTDLGGNVTEKAILLPDAAALVDVTVISDVSGDRIALDQASFSHAPISVTPLVDATRIEWHFDTFLTNQLEELSFDVVLQDPQAGEQRLVTQKLALSYINALGGARIHTELGPQSVYVSASPFDLVANTHQLNYGPNSPVSLEAVVTNLGTTTNSATLLLQIEDANGQLVDAFPPIVAGPISAGQALTLNETWNTDLLIAGGYRLHAILQNQNGEPINEAFSMFSIVNASDNTPVLALSVNVGTDIGNGVFIEKLNYHINDIVEIQTRVTNTSSNTLVTDNTLTVVVIAPGGRTLFEETSVIDAELIPGTIRDHLSSVALNNEVPGTYQVLVTVKDPQTYATLATTNKTFAVAQSLALSVSGDVTLAWPELLLGDVQQCTDTIKNKVAVPTNNLNLRKSLVNIDTQQEMHAVDMPLSLQANQALVQVRDENTTGMSAGNYACLLRVNIDGELQTLGFAAFKMYNLMANPGANQTALVGDIVTLDGSGSREAHGQALSYTWRFVSIPQNSAAEFSNANAVEPEFIVDEQGVYVIELIVNNGTEDSLPKRVIITVPNRKPGAHAGPDQAVQVGDTVILDGSSSLDLDGDTLSYRWRMLQQPAGSSSHLSDVAAVSPRLLIDVAGVYRAELIVNDGIEDSDPDTVLFNVGNVPPVARAGADLVAQIGDMITLDGSGSSDVNGDILKFAWVFVSKPSGSQAVLLNNGGVKPTFIVDKSGDYIIRLIVNDGLSNSDGDTVTVSVGNSAPVANAGPDRSVNASDYITLDGRGSTDLNGDNLRYRWSIIAKPQGSTARISNPYIFNPWVYIDVEGDYVIQLIVNDGLLDSQPDQLILSAGNLRPIAEVNYFGTGEIYSGDKIALDGYDSYDPDGDSLTYRWTFVDRPAGSNALIEGADTQASSFVVDMPGTYIVQLIVNDGELDSEPETVFIEGAQACVENLAIRPKSGKIQLTWTHNPSTEFIQILRSGTLSGPYEFIAETNSTYATYLDEELQNGTTYYYQIDRFLPDNSNGELTCVPQDGFYTCGGMYCDDIGDGLLICGDRLCEFLTDNTVRCDGDSARRNNCREDDGYCEYVCYLLEENICGGASGPNGKASSANSKDPYAKNGEIPECLIEEFPEFNFDQCFVETRQQCRSQIIASQPAYRVRMTSVPDLAGMTPEQAGQVLSSAKLQLGEITTERTTAVPSGQIIRQDVPRNSLMPQDSAIHIVVSTR